MINEELKDVSAEIGFEQPKISNQICGKWFPDTPTKPGTRWFYRLLAIMIIGSIISQVVGVIAILVGSL